MNSIFLCFLHKNYNYTILIPSKCFVLFNIYKKLIKSTKKPKILGLWFILKNGAEGGT